MFGQSHALKPINLKNNILLGDIFSYHALVGCLLACVDCLVVVYYPAHSVILPVAHE